MKKYCVITTGLPASGKSTTIKDELIYRLEEQNGKDVVVISSDALIEEKAALEGKTYDEVFTKYAKWADRKCKQDFEDALNRDVNIVVDRTNLYEKSRNKWLNQINDSEYEVVVIEFIVPSSKIDDWKKRLSNRPGKTIPDEVLNRMVNSQTPYEGDYPRIIYNTFK